MIFFDKCLEFINKIPSVRDLLKRLCPKTGQGSIFNLLLLPNRMYWV